MDKESRKWVEKIESQGAKFHLVETHIWISKAIERCNVCEGLIPRGDHFIYQETLAGTMTACSLKCVKNMDVMIEENA